MQKIVKLSILILLISFTTCSHLVYATSNDSSPLDEFLISSDDISHGFYNKEYQDETLTEEGFIDGRSVNYNRLFDNIVIMELHIRVYRFSSTEDAYDYYNKTIEEIKSNQYYYEIEIPSAFTIITEDQNAEIGQSWSQMNDLVFNIEIINEANFEDTEEMLVYYTELELDAIPEFQPLTLILIFVIATISINIIKKKLSFQN